MTSFDTPRSVPIVLHPPFGQDGGRCWTVGIDSALFPLTDDIGFVTRSILTLRENGVLLGPGHASHDDIRQQGDGRFSHWRHRLYFSTSDGSDPNGNGRTYTVEPSEAIYFAERADYALGIVEFYATHLPGGLGGFAGRRVMEIGPGPDMGTVLVMACLGAEVSVVDRYPADWRTDGWHAKFLKALEERMAQRGWDIDPGPLRRSAEAGAFDPGRVRPIRLSLEELGGGFDGIADLTVSHAAFEHLFSVPLAFQALHRIMAAGARGIHRVDFRDHRNFARPFEFLLLGDTEYDALSGDAKYQHGNRMRPAAMEDAFRGAGFSEVAFIAENATDPAYLDDFLPRLRQAVDSPFRGAPADALTTTGGTFLVVR